MGRGSRQQRVTLMPATSDHYDVIVIGSGPGGGALAQRLAATGKRILMLERGGYLPRSQANWDSKTVFVDGTYQAPETWYGSKGETFHPGLHYFVGGNSRSTALRCSACASATSAPSSTRTASLRPGRSATMSLSLLHRGGEALPRPWPAGRGPDRTLVQRALHLSAGHS